MKKYTLLLGIILLFLGCSDTVEFNNPAVQANFEGQTWRATIIGANTSTGTLVIKASRGLESISLTTTSTLAGNYPLGGENLSEARFTDAEGVVYSTLNSPDSSVQVYPSDGLIEIIDAQNTAEGATGTFWFNAFTEDGLQSVNFIEGNFFMVPIAGETIID